MWKVLAVFLLLVVLVAVSALNKEGLSWMLTIFFAFIGAGVFIYALNAIGKLKQNTKEIKDIKNVMGSAEFKKEEYTVAPTPIETPALTNPESHVDAPQANEIHVPVVETPNLSESSDSGASSGDKSDSGTVTPITLDLAALRSKLKRDTLPQDKTDA